MDCILSTRKKDFGWSLVSTFSKGRTAYRSIFVDPSTYWRLGIEGRRCPYGGGCDAGFAMGFCRERGGIFSPAQTDRPKSHFTFTLYMCQNSVLNTRTKICTYVIGTNQAGNFAKSTCNFTSVAAERNLPQHVRDLPLKLEKRVCKILSSFSSKFIPL